MSNGVVVRTNLAQFKQQIDALGRRFGGRVVPRANRAAGVVFRDLARLLAPVLRTPDPRRVAGSLRRNIYTGRSRDAAPGAVSAFVGVKTSRRRSNVQQLKLRRSGKVLDPFWWRFLEGGWTPRGRGKKLRGGTRSRALQRSRNAAAGAQQISRPFLAPAFERGKVRALAAFVAAMERGIKEESARER